MPIYLHTQVHRLIAIKNYNMSFLFYSPLRYGVRKFLPNHSQVSSLQGWLLRSPRGAQQTPQQGLLPPKSRRHGQAGKSWDGSMEDQGTHPRREVSSVQTCHAPVRSGSCPPDLSLPWKTAYNWVLIKESSWHVFLSWLLNQLDHMHNFSSLAWIYLLCYFCMSPPLQQLSPIACQRHHHVYASASETTVGWFLVWTWEIWVSNTGALSHRKTRKDVEVADRKSSWLNVRGKWKEKEPNVSMSRGYANPRFHQGSLLKNRFRPHGRQWKDSYGLLWAFGQVLNP